MSNYYLNIDLNNKKFIYFLGLFWADGSINRNTISLEFSVKDLDSISNILNDIGVWRFRRRFRKNSNTETVSFTITDKEYIKFFKENDYEFKSRVQPTKILSIIPDELKYLFFLGLYDGDGSIYFNSKTKTYNNKMSITSTINYNWEFLENYLKLIGIDYYSIFNKSYKSGSSSDLQVCQTHLILKLCKELYKTHIIDNIGLKRKYEKYKLIEYFYNTRNEKLNLSKERNQIKKDKIDNSYLDKLEKYYKILKNSKDKNISLSESCLVFGTTIVKYKKFLNNISTGIYWGKQIPVDFIEKFNNLIQT